MELTEIRQKKQQLEQGILQLIRDFETETTILVEKIIVNQATNPQEFPQQKTVDINVSAIVF